MLMEEFGPNYKYAKDPSLIFQSSTPAAAAQFRKTFASSEFAAGGAGPNSGFPHEEKTPELLNETTRAISANCRSGTSTRCLHLQPRVLCRSRQE